jgi:hypothetical protein
MSRISLSQNGSRNGRGDRLLRRPKVDRGELLLLEVGPGTGPQDPPELEEHHLIGHVEHALGPLLGQQQRRAPGPQLGGQLDELRDDQRREAEGGSSAISTSGGRCSCGAVARPPRPVSATVAEDKKVA